jgi:hypothetical protein
MIRVRAFWIALGLAAATAPAVAEQPIPNVYPEESAIQRAIPDKPPGLRAREEVSAAAAQAACNAGDQAGCAALGRAYKFGEGMPQNRPVAELLLRQACDGAEAAGCLDLGILLRTLEQPGPREEGLVVLGRGCRLGNLEACAEEADAVERGPDGDTDRANALRRAACDRGGTTACRMLGSSLASSEKPATRADGLGLLERQCRSGDEWGCERLIFELERQKPPPAALIQEMTEVACLSGNADRCSALGKLQFEAASGPPESRAAALASFDRACALSDTYCNLAENIRKRPVLAESCAKGVQSDCAALGKLYSEESSLLYSPVEAAELLGGACAAGVAESCSAAARIIAYDNRPDTPQDEARMVQWLDLGCKGGASGDCEKLAKRLLEGEPTPEDRARAYALLEQACTNRLKTSCETLDELARTDASAPLLSVDWRYSPPQSPEQLAEERRLKEELDAKQKAEQEANRCSITDVTFRGVTYHDRLCDRKKARVTFGRLAKRSEAPWQALLWRPQQMDGLTLTPGQRVECGGALVRAGWILTAAHCVVDGKKRLQLTPGHEVRLGVYVAFGEEGEIRPQFPGENEGESYRIRDVFVHPRYHEKSRTFDIALIRLDTSRPIRRGEVGEIRAVPFDQLAPDQRQITRGTPVFVYGWGQTKFEGDTSNSLKTAELKLEAPGDCEASTGTGLGYLKGSLLCAKAADRSQACDGDSGGPLILYEKSGPVVIGVVSAGTRCGETGVATRYTRVGSALDWIARVLRGTERPIEPLARQ